MKQHMGPIFSDYMYHMKEKHYITLAKYNSYLLRQRVKLSITNPIWPEHRESFTRELIKF